MLPHTTKVGFTATKCSYVFIGCYRMSGRQIGYENLASDGEGRDLRNLDSAEPLPVPRLSLHCSGWIRNLHLHPRCLKRRRRAEKSLAVCYGYFYPGAVGTVFLRFPDRRRRPGGEQPNLAEYLQSSEHQWLARLLPPLCFAYLRLLFPPELS